MKAEDFNLQVEEALQPMLESVGFRLVGNDYVREDELNQLVFFRFSGSKFASLCQSTRFMLCFRHRFLRDMQEEIPKGHPKEGHAYPFRVKPSSLASLDVASWRYKFELNPESYDEVTYGDLADARPILKEIGTQISTKGLDWALRFTPTEAYHQISSDGDEVWVNRLWLEDYTNHLN